VDDPLTTVHATPNTLSIETLDRSGIQRSKQAYFPECLHDLSHDGPVNCAGSQPSRFGPPGRAGGAHGDWAVSFAYVVCHFINNAFGVRSVEAMQAASAYLITPWQTWPGLVILYGSLFLHGFLGLLALHRRRHLRMPAGEAWQLALGLSIPL